jgi:hypothetical protein
LLLNFAVEYAIRKVQENQVGLKLNWTDQLLLYVDDMNLLGGNVDTVAYRSVVSGDSLNSGRCQVTPVKYTHATIEERCIL